MPEVLAVVNGALQDPAVGLTAKVTALAPADARILRTFGYSAWVLEGSLRASAQPNVMVRPRGWAVLNNKKDEGRRRARARVEIGYEYFGSVLVDIQDNVAILATAVAQVIDELRAYSDAHAGTIEEVEEGTLFDFGQFAGPTSHGFIASVSILERSGQ